MKDFFKSLTVPVTITMKFSMLMGFISLFISVPFQSWELLGVSLFLFVISNGKDDDFDKFAS